MGTEEYLHFFNGVGQQVEDGAKRKEEAREMKWWR